jgi:hypothetical protein
VKDLLSNVPSFTFINQTFNALIRSSYTRTHIYNICSIVRPWKFPKLLWTLQSRPLAFHTFHHFSTFPYIYLEKGRWNESSTFIPTSLFLLSWYVFTTAYRPYSSFLRADTFKPNNPVTLLPILSLVLLSLSSRNTSVMTSAPFPLRH